MKGSSEKPSDFIYKKSDENKQRLKMKKRIGNTTYEVAVYFSDFATESFDEKILRLTKDDLLYSEMCTMLNQSQTGRKLEGGSLWTQSRTPTEKQML